jgi:hypothetical protein
MKRLPKSHRQAISKRARFRCEYCRFPEYYSYHPYQVDHILSIKHGGTNSPKNLAWACSDCNNAKGSDVGSFDKITKTFVPFFNPRSQNWDDEFDIEAGYISGKTPSARVTVIILQMNQAERVEARRLLIEAGFWE